MKHSYFSLKFIYITIFLLLAGAGLQAQTTWYQDSDSDGFGNPSLSQTALSQPTGYVLNNLDFNDGILNNKVWNNVGNAAGVTVGTADFTSLVVDKSGVVYLAYRDGDNGGKLTVSKFNGTVWETVGTAGFSAGTAYFVDITLDADGMPYVVYGDGSNNRAMVKRFNNDAWETVGTATLPTATVSTGNATAITIDKNGIPYIIFSDSSWGGYATVMKYVDDTWELVGAEHFSGAQAGDCSLAVADDGTVYAVFENSIFSLKYSDTELTVKVMKFAGTTWETTETLSFLSLDSAFPSIAINGNTPYIAYADAGKSGKVSVKKYNGTTWDVIGTTGFSGGNASQTNVSIAINNAGIPYVAYRDGGNASVKKFNGTAWETVGSAGFSAGKVTYPMITFDAQDIPYVAYKDVSIGNKAAVMKIAPGKLDQTITFSVFTDKKIGDTDFEPGATTNSGLPLTYTSSNTAVADVYQDTEDGNKWKIKIIGIGETDITVAQSGNTNYNAADLMRTLKVIEGTLPINLMNYTARAENNKAKLEWTTTSENNNKEFIISRSVNGIDFTELGRVAGSGNSSAKRNYSYYDKSPLTGNNYYKLVQVDNDGKETELGIRILSFTLSAFSLQLYPNPTTDKVTLTFETGKYTHLTVLNLSGKTLQNIQTKPSVSSIEVGLGVYPKGTYLLQLRGKDGTEVIKVLKK